MQTKYILPHKEVIVKEKMPFLRLPRLIFKLLRTRENRAEYLNNQTIFR